MYLPEQIVVAIRENWARDTSFTEDEWSIDNPARGQCVVSALTVQYFLGGELRKYDTVFQGKDETHYYNVLQDGTVIDVSREQYPEDQELIPSEVNLHGYRNVRDKMMHEPRTVTKYKILLKRVSAKLGA